MFSYINVNKNEKVLEVDIELKKGETYSVFLTTDGNGWKLQEKNEEIDRTTKKNIEKKVRELLSYNETKQFLKKSEQVEEKMKEFCSDSFLKRMNEMELLYMEESL